MDQNYKININPKQPSSEDIARHQDFDALLEQFKATPAPPKAGGQIRRLIYIGAAVAAVAAAVLVFIINPAILSPNISSDEYFAQQEFINPPIQSIETDFKSQKINVNQGGVFEYASGSRMVVPAAAFMNDRGTAVEGEVNIHFKEYHDFVDFFLSGIPLHYDSAGQRYHLESAGMVEIYAEQNGQRLTLAPNKAIEVELVSEIILPNGNIVPNYNIYRLDTANRNWVYQDIDKIQLLEDEVLDTAEALYPLKKELLININEIEAKAANELAEIEASVPKPVEPLKPQRKNGENPSLELDFLGDNLIVEGASAEKRAQLKAMYEGTIWQISPKSPAIDERAFNVAWENAQLKPLNNIDYELTLLSGDNQVQLIVNPVLTGSDYDNAIAQYEAARASYEQLMAEREAQLKAKKDALESQTQKEKTLAQEAFNNRLNALRDQGLEYATTQEIIKRKVINRFTVNQFGVFNCGRPLLPDEHEVRATFVDQNGKRYANHTAFLVDKSKNTINRFYASRGAVMNFNTQSENLMWIVTDGEQIAVFSPENFRAINDKKGGYTFRMNLIEQKIASEADLRQVLSF